MFGFCFLYFLLVGFACCSLHRWVPPVVFCCSGTHRDCRFSTIFLWSKQSNDLLESKSMHVTICPSSLLILVSVCWVIGVLSCVFCFQLFCVFRLYIFFDYHFPCPYGLFCCHIYLQVWADFVLSVLSFMLSLYLHAAYSLLKRFL